jgi:hypothetical protein
LRGYGDDSPLGEMRMKAKEGERQCGAEKRAGNRNRSVQVEDDPWWAQIIERRLCEKVVADWRATVGKRRAGSRKAVHICS